MNFKGKWSSTEEKTHLLDILIVFRQALGGEFMIAAKNESKKRCLFRIFPSIIVFNALKSIASISNVLMRMNLIDCTAQGKKERIVTTIFLIILAVFAENIVSILKEAQRIRIKRNYSLKAIGDIAEKNSKLTLEQQESRTVQELVEKADSYFGKAMEYTDAVSCFVDLALIASVLLFLLRHSPLYISLTLGILIFITFLVNLRSTKNTFGFWERYMDTVRRSNYFSDLQTQREYAYERRVYQTSQAMDRRFSEAFDQAAETNKRSGISRFWGQAVSEVFIISITIFTLFYFAIPTSVECISLGRYAAITEMMARLLACLSVCAEGVFKVREFLGLYSELNAFLNSPEPLHKNLSDISSSKWIASIDNVSFRYPGSTIDTISNFTFHFEMGKHYGLVGVNGSGKTTLVKLLLDLYAPSSGSVETVQMSTALFQDFQIYPVTVREYLSMGNKNEIPDDQLYNVLQQLNCSPLKNGLNTMLTLIDAQGTSISKGQLQKLAIARAFLSKAKLVILDEPTASLDPISEREIYLLSQKLLRDKTVIFISHRLGAVSGLDEILVMDRGQLRESGTHESLMALNGLYSKLYLTQKGMYVDED